MATSETSIGGEEEDTLALCISLLKEECDPAQFQTAVNTLLKILRNVLAHPTESKYCELKTSNPSFVERVWRFSSAQQFLVASGWAEVDDKVMMLERQYLSRAVAVLEKASRTSQVVNGATQSQGQPRGHESEKDRLIDEDRRKQVEQMKKEKEERKRIAEMIKADRKETQTRKSKDSVARTRDFGMNLNRFKDIGVDLNRGGG